jgi:hypothetical protein
MGDCDLEISKRTEREIKAFRNLIGKPKEFTEEIRHLCFIMFMYAEDYENSLADSLGRAYPKECKECIKWVKLFNKYRIKTFGHSALDVKMSKMKSYSVQEIMKKIEGDNIFIHTIFGKNN